MQTLYSFKRRGAEEGSLFIWNEIYEFSCVLSFDAI